MNLVTVLAWLLAAICFGAGAFNLAGSRKVRETFAQYGYPSWWHVLTGILEMAGAVLTVMPSTRRLGATLLAAVMIAAFVTVVRHKDRAAIVPAAVLALVAGYIAWHG